MCSELIVPSRSQAIPFFVQAGVAQYSASPSTSQSGHVAQPGLHADIRQDLVRPSWATVCGFRSAVTFGSFRSRSDCW